MNEPEDDQGLSQEDLHRLGLGRRPRPPRPPGGSLLFLKDLRPPWPRLGRTVLLAAVLTGLSRIPYLRFYIDLSGAGDSADLPTLAWILLQPFRDPLRLLNSASMQLFVGAGFLAAPLALTAGSILLLRRRSTHPGLAIFFLIVGVVGTGWALFGPVTESPWLISPVFPFLTIAGAAVGSWLLLWPAGSPSRRRALPIAAVPLMASTAVALNLRLLVSAPAFYLALTLNPDLLQSYTPPSMTFYEVMNGTSALIGFPLVTLPALIVAEGLGLREALATLWQAVRRSPLMMLLAHLGLALLMGLPGHSFLSSLVGHAPLLAWAIELVLAGLTLGVFVYATALIARAARRCVDRAV